MLLAVADDQQPNGEGQPSADHRTDGTVVGDDIARKTGQGEQVDEVRRETQGKETVVHVVKRVR